MQQKGRTLRLIYGNELKQMIFGKENIGRLYDRYSEKLYYTSLRITADPMDAEEAMHDTFMKYHRTKERIGNIEAWLTRVCIRNSIDIIRKRKAEELFMEEISPADNMKITNLHDEEPPEIEYTVEKIRKGMLELPDGYRMILSLYLFEGYDYTEIAQITRLKESSVRSQYQRARNRLSEILRRT